MEPESSNTSLSQIVIKFSLIYALGIIALILIFALFFTTLQTSWVHSAAQYIVAATSLVFGMKARRNEQLGGYMTYGQGLATGTLIGLGAAVLVAIYQVIHLNYIDPEYMNYVIEEAKRKMIEKGNTEEQIDMAVSWMEKMKSPGIAFVLSFFGSFLMSFIFSLIIAIFMRRNNPDAAYKSLEA
jgi:hypothetical protein